MRSWQRASTASSRQTAHCRALRTGIQRLQHPAQIRNCYAKVAASLNGKRLSSYVRSPGRRQPCCTGISAYLDSVELEHCDLPQCAWVQVTCYQTPGCFGAGMRGSKTWWPLQLLRLKYCLSEVSKAKKRCYTVGYEGGCRKSQLPWPVGPTEIV